jgi:aminoglycoside phosphotransferase (APT) family kinase protein
MSTGETVLLGPDSCGPVRPGFEIDVRRLEPYLAASIDGFHGGIEVRQFTGGQSNPTYLIQTPAGRYVLRRKPPGQLLASAHAIDREYRVTDALGRFTDVPVARARCLCLDESVIGTPFFVMDHVEGRIFWDVSLPQVAREQRAALFDEMTATIARLHTVDPRAIGLADFGKPDGYVARQIRRWSRQYLEDREAGQVPDMQRLIGWLESHMPAEDASSLIHGDFRCDNLVFHPTEAKIVAILDWELSTLGHPLADFAYYLMIYHLPTIAFPGLADVDLAAAGLPSERASVATYCRIAGRSQVPDLRYYVVLNLF